jgi:hypothetical protein
MGKDDWEGTLVGIEEEEPSSEPLPSSLLSFRLSIERADDLLRL